MRTLLNYTLHWNEKQQIPKNTQIILHQHRSQKQLTTTKPNKQQNENNRQK